MSNELQRLGKYQLLERLGQGGMAEVWKALDTQLQRFVAIKVLHADLQADPNFITRFEREAQLIASLHHPNIVQIHDFQVTHSAEPNTPLAYMVMTYVEGQTLATYIANTSGKGKIPSPSEIVNLFTSISLAVDYAHQKGMIHRDIKPANILLDRLNTTRNPMGEPILTDFGLAKLLGTSASTLSATLVGTPLYTSPEQARGYPGNERSDLYSLGVILYEIVTGVTPFRGDTPVVVVTQHMNAAPPSPALYNPNIPPALSMVLLKALAKDPNARFASAATLTAAAAEALNIPVPESLGKPAFPADPLDMPTYITPLPAPQAAATPALSTSPTAISSPPTPASSSSGQMPAMTPAMGSSTPGISFPGQTVPNPPTPMPAYTPQIAVHGATGAAQTSPPIIHPTPAPSAPGRRRWRGLYTALIIVVLVFIGSGIGSFLLLSRNATRGTVVAPPPTSIVGQAFFASSGQLNPGSAQGIADQLEIKLNNIAPPQSGKQYYAWLLPDKNPKAEADPLQPTPQFTLPLLVMPLTVTNGQVNVLYHGTAAHDNLFSLSSRLLITEENSSGTPRSPAADHSAWRYYAEIPQTAYGTPPLSALDHIRHLFYKETRVEVLGLPGGLDIWLFRNTEKILEWASSARDDYDAQGSHADQMHTLFVNMLDYLDGAPNVHVDIPGGPVYADPTVSKVGLLSVDTPQIQLTELSTNPPGYVDHMQLHLNGVIKAPDATPAMRQQATQIITALGNASKWLKEVRNYAKQLVSMNQNQLSQPSSLTMINNLLTNATYAYIGQLDPQTNKVTPGVTQVHYLVQQLATLTITKNLPQTL